MEINYEQLLKKCLSFWNKFDGKEFTSKELREYFDIHELVIIITSDEFCGRYYNIINSFVQKIKQINYVFTQSEAERLIREEYYSPDLFKYLSDETLISLIREDDTYITSIIADNLSTNEMKIKAFNMVESPWLKAEFIKNFDNDKLKLDYLKKVPKNVRTQIIISLKDENLIEQFIKFYSQNKSEIISKFSNDEKKYYYLKKYFMMLDNDEKAQIISSIKDDKLVIECLQKCNDKVKVEVVCSKKLNKEIMDKVMETIKNKKDLADILKYGRIPSELIVKYIDKISDIKDFTEIIYRLDAEYQIKYLKKFNDKIKFKIISSMYDKKTKFDALEYINDKQLIFEIIQHTDNFPEYTSEYEYIIELYSKKYSIDKNRLMYAVNHTSLSILKSLDNPNIIKILNSSEKEFEKIMQFFNKEDLKMTNQSMNDFLNTVLQRKFKIDSPEIILMYPYLLNAIQNKDNNYLVFKLKEISEKIDINNIIIENNWTFDMFINKLIEKNEEAINCLHVITQKYIIIQRNEYIKQNLIPTLEKCTMVKYNIKDLLKKLFIEYPIELNMQMFSLLESEEYNKDNILNLTPEEIEFLEKKELIKKIMQYKKNPGVYDTIPEDIKQNMKVFNSILEKFLKDCPASQFPGIEIDRKNYGFEEIDTEFIINIMKNIDIDIMRKDILNNNEAFDILMKFWKQYKMGGWAKSYELILNDSGLMVSEEILANFIHYFSFSYETLKEKVEKKELANISITALIDLAACFSSDSKKYSMIFGEEDYKYIASNPGPNSASMIKTDRIEKALEYIKIIRTRKHITIPPVDKNFELKNGKKINIVVGNFSNPINLTYGERTGACMRIGGAGESLFDACLKDENCFHIRFTNPNNGKFVSRVSGFRNGNTVFLNELRFSEDSNYTNEDVVESCQMIAKELIELSMTSNYPIDNVVVTPYYAMEKSNMHEQSLNISDPQQGMKKFYTDVCTTSVLLATSDKNDKLVKIKLGIKDVPKYTVIRDKQKILYNKDCQKYVSHLKSMDQFLSGISIDEIEEEINDELIFCYAGEDWCIMVDRNGKIEKYIMNNSVNKEQALIEVEQAMNYLNENLDKLITVSNNISMGM